MERDHRPSESRDRRSQDRHQPVGSKAEGLCRANGCPRCTAAAGARHAERESADLPAASGTMPTRWSSRRSAPSSMTRSSLPTSTAGDSTAVCWMASRGSTNDAQAPRQRAGRTSELGAEDVSPQVVKLSWAERLDILDGLSLLLDQIYVHLPLKRSLYGFDIIRALASLRQQSTSISDIQFHRELTTLINRLRDAHTQYQGPWTQRGRRGEPAVSCRSLSARQTTRPTSSRRSTAMRSRTSISRKAVEITHWNGIPFGRALDLHAEVETGGRPDSRRARASNRSPSAPSNMRRRRMKNG